ncbi:MAG TPA: VOC family protein [Chitinophagaceae bacterium]|jgi:predicted 3-demethylubiquinone-9 3-methyltransferase (glyoxalase superfamily)
MQKITPFLWFDNQAEDAVNFYCSVFKNAKKKGVARYDEEGAKASGRPKGSVMTAAFEIEDHEFVALNGGPVFKINPSISFFANSKIESEVIELYDKLSAGGTVLMPLDKYPFSDKYAWVQDKYGVSWQLILSMGEIKQRIVPSMMFVGKVCGKAEEAINFYTSIFSAGPGGKNSKIGNIFRYGANQGPDKEGTIAFADFELNGEWFAAMDSAHEHNFTFTEALSFVVNCETQEEVDYYWKKLVEGGQESVCGWLKDKFGLSWQVVPVVLSKFLSDRDPKKSQRVMHAMLQMKKIDIPALEKAYNQQ